MIVVSDTGPLNYLAVLGHLEVLPELYVEVVIPQAVSEELSRPASPQVVRSLIEAPVPWLKISEVQSRDPGLVDLGDGEQEAIVLARALSADLLLCDDRDARNAAVQLDIRVIGTIGVLKEAADKKLLDLADALIRLRRTNFRISKTVLASIINQYKGTQ